MSPENNTGQTLAIFDLDNTLIAGDSDHAWGEFMIARGLVDANSYRRQNDAFYEQYKRGELDVNAYLRFALQPLAGKQPEELAQLHARFMEEIIQPMMLDKARELLDSHRSQGHYLLIITATNDFITRPIANALGVDDILASEAEVVDGVYTGQPTGTPCFHMGKVTRLNSWLQDRQHELGPAWFYSDSHNDIPLLDAVGNPIAVDPDDTLRRHATDRGWPVISLRE